MTKCAQVAVINRAGGAAAESGSGGGTGNDYAMARYNVNRLGRFSSPDPLSGSITGPQSLNHYTYAGNNPVNAIDPTGQSDIYATQAPDPRLSGCGTLRTDAAIILHEYAHNLGLVLPDANDNIQSMANTNAIASKCKAGLALVPNH